MMSMLEKVARFPLIVNEGKCTQFSCLNGFFVIIGNVPRLRPPHFGNCCDF